MVYVHWIDDANTKKTISYRLDHVGKKIDGGFVSMLADSKYISNMVVRLCCENKIHFQCVKCPQIVVKSELAEGVPDLVDLEEEVEVVDLIQEVYDMQEVQEGGNVEAVEKVEEVEEVEWEEGEIVAEVMTD